MATTYTSPLHVFSLADITGTFGGETFPDNPDLIDTAGTTMEPYVDKDGNVLYGIDSEFGYYVTDFIGAEQKVLDGDYAEGWAGNIYDPDDPTTIVGLSLYNAETDVFRSGAPIGTWSLGLGGQTVKASTEHYNVMADVLSDQAYAGDPSAVAPLDDDLKILDLRPTGANGELQPGLVHNFYVAELTEALQRAMDGVETNANPTTYTDIDFDRDGTADTFTAMDVTIQADTNGDGVTETITVGGIDLDGDNTADVVDGFLNGFGGKADLTDVMAPNEDSITYDIAYSQDYSVTVKDDGKLLYRWGEAVKRPNDIRMEVNMDLPDEWIVDADSNGVADATEDGSLGFAIISAELVVNHDITNNPNDQIRPEDWENEAAIGRVPSHYIVQDPDDPSNTLWVSPVDSYNGEGEALPSYFKLTADGEIDMTAGGTAVYDPDGNLVGYRNEDAGGNPIGTVLRDMSLVALNETAGLSTSSEDLEEGFTTAWYTSVDREPFEWSYDMYSDDPYKNVYESFRFPEDAADAGYTEADLYSGPRWRLTPNKFGQDLPGLEIPLTPNSQPPYQKDNIKYETGETITTTINLLDWDADIDGDGVPDPSPFKTSDGWMLIDPTRLDENGDGVIDDGWSKVDDGSGNLVGAGDTMPTGPILSAVTPNGMNLTHEFFDTAVYIKGDRSDSAKIYDMELHIEYAPIEVLGSVQEVTGLNVETTTGYQDGTVYDNPVVFMTPPTMNGNDVATVQITEVTETGVTAYIKETSDLDGNHRGEDVAMLTFEEGEWNLVDGTKLEVGTVEIPKGATNDYVAVTFDTEFESTPTVMVQLQTENGAQWAVARVRNVTEDGFEVALQEQESAKDGFHVAEIVGWMAIEADNEAGLIDWGDLDSQAFLEQDLVNSDGGSITLDESVGVDPLVAAFLSSVNGKDPVTLRQTGMTDDGVSATISYLAQEEQSFDEETGHRLEDLHGLAFEQAGLLTGFEMPDEFVFV